MLPSLHILNKDLIDYIGTMKISNLKSHNLQQELMYLSLYHCTYMYISCSLCLPHLFTLDDVSVMYACKKYVLALMDVSYANNTLSPNG